jgi:uncharacterized protein (TIRG00374 family)
LDRKTKLLLKLFFSLLLFVAIFYFVGFQKITALVLAMDPWLFLLAILSYILVLFAMSLRIEVVLDSIGEKVSLREIFPSNLAGMLASDFTPARVGYFFTAFSLSSSFGIKLEKTFLSIFGPQLLDFVIKLSSATILLMIIFGRLGADGLAFNLVFLLITLAAIVFSGLLVFHPPFMRRLRFLEHLPLASKCFSFLSRMHTYSDRLLSIKWKITGVTLLAWFLKGAHWMLLSKAVGFSIMDNIFLDFVFIMLFQAAITLIQFFPLPTLAGAGASEAGFAAILYLFGLPLEVGVTFGFMTRVVMIVVDAFSLPMLYDFVQKHGVDDFLSKLLNNIF